MSLVLFSTAQTITVALAAATTTNPVVATASYADQTGVANSAAPNDISLSTTTVTTLVPAPAANVSRVVNSISIFNHDTVTATVTVSRLVSGTSYSMISVQIPAGAHLYYEGAGGWRSVDSSGNFRELVQASQSGTWTVAISAGSAAIGTVDVTSLPALPAGSNAIGSVTIYNAPFTLTGAFSITTTAHTFSSTTGFSKLRLAKIDLYGYVNASANSLMLVDGSGATIFNIAIPAIATALTDTNFFFSELLNISMNNASGGMSCSLANNPSSGSVFAQFGVSN
jgi:hypothetical protein